MAVPAENPGQQPSPVNGGPEHACESAIEVLMAAATRLPLPACEQLSMRIIEYLVLAGQDHAYDLSPYASRRRHLLGALRAVTESLGHPPTSSEYQAEYERRKALDGTHQLPARSSIIREFRTWPGGLAAAGLTPQAPPSAFLRRRDYQRHITHRYSPERLRHCLKACARDLGRIPMVRDYIAWRENALGQPRPVSNIRPDIPHYRTFYTRFGDWDSALADAGLAETRADRTTTNTYNPLIEIDPPDRR